MWDVDFSHARQRAQLLDERQHILWLHAAEDDFDAMHLRRIALTHDDLSQMQIR
jgi:hypothetical protein